MGKNICPRENFIKQKTPNSTIGVFSGEVREKFIKSRTGASKGRNREQGTCHKG
jgi:hypothetical protein